MNSNFIVSFSVELRGQSNYSSSLTNSDQEFSGCSAASSRRASHAAGVGAGSRRSSAYQGGAAAAAASAVSPGGPHMTPAVGPPHMTPAVEVATGPPPSQYRVAMLGASGVGKSSLTSQFLSSDHMNTYASVGKCGVQTKKQGKGALS